MFDIEKLLESGGILLVGLIVFAESGLLIGFFLPGDTLLFTAGFFAAQGKMSIYWLLATIITAAIVGDNVGYTIGRHAGKRIFKKKDGLFFRKEYVEKAQDFYERHGGKTIILARFTPIVRTFAPIVAGVGKMSRRKFAFYNVIGAFIWAISVTLTGYFLGTKIPHVDKYIEPIIIAAVLFAFAPSIYHILKDLVFRRRPAEVEATEEENS